MSKITKKTISPNFTIYIIPILVCFFNVLIILFPKEIIESSKNGLLLWFNNVVPSLLPFIIGTNLLISLGFIEFIGTFTEKIMTKMFGVSGKCIFVVIMGMMSGYPIGAKITADLLKKNEITLKEAEKLITFTNNSGPLFILGTVAVTMFSSLKAGIAIISAHYISSLIIGLLYNISDRKSNKKDNNRIAENKNINLLITAFKNLKKYREKENNTFGTILGMSIKNTTETILSIGGFVILFSVISKSLEIIGIYNALETLLTPFFNFINADTNIIKPIFTGMLEITNGCRNLSEYPVTYTTVSAACAIISWGGFSIHAQAISFLAKTGIRTKIYFISKIIHSLFSGFCCYAILKLFNISFENTASQTQEQLTAVFANTPSTHFISSSKLFIYTIICSLLICLFYFISKHILERKAK